jgi:2-polyprenyl-6-methoxyphenol hydroxylase-like FAD-dependent oxidoreductase
MNRAIVIGGSLGGLFAGCMLLRSGWNVIVVERSEGRLAGRGAGLGVHPPMIEGLLQAGAHVDGSIGIAVKGRAVLARDGSIAAEIAMPQFCTSWARLYSLLSDAYPEERVRRGVALTRFEQDSEGVTAYLSDGTSLRGDVLVGADGVRSMVRRQMLPGVELDYAGYIGWRGMVDETTLSAATHAALFHRFAWGLIPGEHILGYPVPGLDDDMTPGRRRYSFVWYRRVAEPLLRDMQTDATGHYHADGIPPRLIRPELLEALRCDAYKLLCPAWAEVVRKADQPLFQAVGDLESPSMAVGRVALLGDAAFVARPHVARGAIKAGHDAMALTAALAEAPVIDALQRYDSLRRPASLLLVEESRRLGAYIDGKGERTTDPIAFMRENGGVEASMVDGGLFIRLQAEAGHDVSAYVGRDGSRQRGDAL